MNVKLLTSESSLNDQIYNAALAGLTCTGNEGNLDKPDYDPVGFLKKIIGFGHESVIEHIYLTFKIEDISRALLQELARHRLCSLSVQSTRRTLKKCKNFSDVACEIAKKLISPFDTNEYEHLRNGDLIFSLRTYLDFVESLERDGVSSDIVKYLLPELWPTSLVMTCNLRELRHIFELRTAPAALWEFQDLCREIKNVMPVKLQDLASS